jgi:hypothetical protein
MLTVMAALGVLVLWIVSLGLLGWSWEKHVAKIPPLRRKPEDARVTRREVMWRHAKRHTWGWAIFFLSLFMLLAFGNFPLWERLLFVFALACYYGNIRVRVKGNRAASGELALFSPTRDELWYTGLAIAEWFGYLGLLVFAGQAMAYVFEKI